MKLFNLIGLTCLYVGASLAAQAPIEAEDLSSDDAQAPPPMPVQSTPLRVDVKTTFPDSEVFGVKLVNGRATEAIVAVMNNEDEPIAVKFIGGALAFPDTAGVMAGSTLRNLSTIVYDGSIPAGQFERYTYKVQSPVELNAQELVLKLVALIQKGKGPMYSVPAYNETITVVEAPVSFFDPQILFLYIILAALFSGASYFIYNRYVTVLFPQTKKRTGGKGAERTKIPKSPEKVSVVASDGQATTTAAKAYDESWIPAHHLKRPEAKRVRSGTPTGVKTKSRPA